MKEFLLHIELAKVLHHTMKKGNVPYILLFLFKETTIKGVYPSSRSSTSAACTSNGRIGRRE
jgi:hypothetical protein